MTDVIEGTADDHSELWEWIPGDSDFDIAIPDSERIPLPPTTQLQGRFRNWKQTMYLNGWDKISGRTPLEVIA